MKTDAEIEAMAERLRLEGEKDFDRLVERTAEALNEDPKWVRFALLDREFFLGGG